MASASKSQLADAAGNEVLAEGTKSDDPRQKCARSIDYASAPARLVLANESKPEFEELEKAYYARFQPRNKVESDLVDDMVAARWRLRRPLVVKTQAINLYRNIKHAAAGLRRMQKDRPVTVEPATFEKNAILQNEGNTPAGPR